MLDSICVLALLVFEDEFSMINSCSKERAWKYMVANMKEWQFECAIDCNEHEVRAYDDLHCITKLGLPNMRKKEKMGHHKLELSNTRGRKNNENEKKTQHKTKDIEIDKRFKQSSPCAILEWKMNTHCQKKSGWGLSFWSHT